jgi:hypothetical protein
VYSLNKQKCLFSKGEGREIKHVFSGDWCHGRGKDTRKGCRRENMMEILCTDV